MGNAITFTATDGFEESGYLATPTGAPKGGIVVVQEIFGVNIHIREVCDRFASEGYVALAPAIFDRLQTGVELGYTAEDIEVGRDLARGKLDFAVASSDVIAAANHLLTLLPEGSKVGCVGYCFGGVLTSAAAVHGSPISCGVSYYGTGTVNQIGSPLASPLMCHYGALDGSIPDSDIQKIRDAWPTAQVFVYDAHHGFNCDHRGQYDQATADLARQRTMDFFAEHL